MRLKAFRVTNYKSIVDSGRTEINQNVACLMGKNESGKSAVLQALWKFNNVAEATYDRLLDLPAEHFSRLRTTDPQVISVEFILEDADKKDFEKELPTLGDAPDEVKITSSYDKKRKLDVTLNYNPPAYAVSAPAIKAAIAALADFESNPEQAEASELALISAAQKALVSLDSSGLNKAATEIPNAIILAATSAFNAVPSGKLETEVTQRTAETLKTLAAHNKPDWRSKAEEWIAARLPIFIYFEDYGRLKTRIHLPTFISKVSTPPKDPEEQMLHRTQVALFEWANLSADELHKLGMPRQDKETQDAVDRRKAERSRILESASYHLSGDWMDWWDQRTHNLVIEADGEELELRVSDDINPWKIPFGERSRGFQWFFSFYLTFLVESGRSHKGAIVLLDEPGLHLHPTAQERLLSFFQRISEKNQIVYTSHSMFMVDPDHVDNVRTVYLRPSNPDNPKSRAYTVVSATSEPEGDRDTLLPMQAAGAYRLAQTLFLGKRTLIVEGISDYWLLKTLSNYLHDHGGGELHEDTLVLWAGGTSNMLPLASIMAAREQMGPNRMAVLLDSDRAGLDRARKLIEMMAHGSDSVMLLGDAISISKAQGEDIAEHNELLIALRPLGFSPSDPTKHARETNVEWLRRLFAQNGWGDLTPQVKARIVLQLADSWRAADTVPAPETIARAKRLFDYINDRFTKLHLAEAKPI